MGRKAQHIILSIYLRSLMERELKKRQLEKHFYERIQIILSSAEGFKNIDISNEFGFDNRTVGVWRKRWYNRTKDIDITVDENKALLSDKLIINRVKELLSDNLRSGCPPKITKEKWARLQALACEKPEDYNLPFSSWTHRELSKQALKLGINISSSHYGVLKKKRFTSA